MNWSLKVDALKTMQNEHHCNPCTDKNNDFETNITNNPEEMQLTLWKKSL